MTEGSKPVLPMIVFQQIQGIVLAQYCIVKTLEDANVIPENVVSKQLTGIISAIKENGTVDNVVLEPLNMLRDWLDHGQNNQNTPSDAKYPAWFQGVIQGGLHHTKPDDSY